MDFILPIFYILLFILLIRSSSFFDIPELPKKFLYVLFLIKIATGVILWMIYTYHYTYRDTSDAFRYFDDAAVMFSALPSNPGDFFRMLSGFGSESAHLHHYYDLMKTWFKSYDLGLLNDNRTIVRINAFLHLFSFGYYHVHTVFFCFFAFLGQVALYRVLIRFITGRSLELLFAVFLLPSVLFWSSGVLKEPLLIMALGVFLYLFFNPDELKKRHLFITLFVISAFMLVILKIYILALLVPALVSYMLSKSIQSTNSVWIYLSVHLAFALMAFNLYHLIPEYDILYMLHKKQQDFINVAEIWDAGSFFQIPILETTFISLLKNAPIAFFNTLMRPYIFESNSLFMIVASVENIIIVLYALVLISGFSFRKENLNILLFFISFTVLIFILIGLVTPVSGAIVRYKIPVMPFLLSIFILLSNQKNIFKNTPILKMLLKSKKSTAG